MAGELSSPTIAQRL